MNKLLAVIPVIAHTTTDKCVESILQENNSLAIEKEEILLVDNSKDGFAGKYGLRVHRDPDGHNLGVARAWNVGAKEVLEKELDYLVIISASMLFGPVLHTTWLSQMQTFWGADVIESTGHSWHLVAIHRNVFEKIGLFDSNFYPAYFEQIDFCYRMRMLNMEGNWPKVWNNAMSQGVALHGNLVSIPAPPLLNYYRKKWGGDKGHETFTVPYGNKPIDYFYEETIPKLAKKYKLEEWW